jgi:hypothetical protein
VLVIEINKPAREGGTTALHQLFKPLKWVVVKKKLSTNKKHMWGRRGLPCLSDLYPLSCPLLSVQVSAGVVGLSLLLRRAMVVVTVVTCSVYNK